MCQEGKPLAERSNCSSRAGGAGLLVWPHPAGIRKGGVRLPENCQRTEPINSALLNAWQVSTCASERLSSCRAVSCQRQGPAGLDERPSWTSPVLSGNLSPRSLSGTSRKRLSVLCSARVQLSHTQTQTQFPGQFSRLFFHPLSEQS